MDMNRDGMLNPEDGDWLGIHDPDGNGVPDTVKADAYRTGVDLVISPDPRITARLHLDRVNAFSLGLRPDRRLILVQSTLGETDGRSRVWRYSYQASSPGPVTLVLAIGGILVASEMPADATGFDPLPSDWLDSNAVLTLVEASGGSEFRAANQDWKIECHLPHTSDAILSQAFGSDVFCGIASKGCPPAGASHGNRGNAAGCLVGGRIQITVR
jgi:hypothetical protein